MAVIETSDISVRFNTVNWRNQQMQSVYHTRPVKCKSHTGQMIVKIRVSSFIIFRGDISNNCLLCLLLRKLFQLFLPVASKFHYRKLRPSFVYQVDRTNRQYPGRKGIRNTEFNTASLHAAVIFYICFITSVFFTWSTTYFTFKRHLHCLHS